MANKKKKKNSMYGHFSITKIKQHYLDMGDYLKIACIKSKSMFVCFF